MILVDFNGFNSFLADLSGKNGIFVRNKNLFKNFRKKSYINQINQIRQFFMTYNLILYMHVKAVSRKFTLVSGVNFKISLDFALHICKQTGQKSKSIAYIFMF